MKLSVSNIAWPAELDDSVMPWLVSCGIEAIEVAPTRVWPNWQGMDTPSTRGFRRRVESAGLAISSLQSILYQRPDLKLFGSDRDRQAMRDHLCRCADLAADLGAAILVYGAPKNRNRGSLPEDEAFAIAAGFFRQVGEDYRERGVYLGFEANPPEYGCDFGTESGTAARLVRAVASPGFGLHLDTACLHLAGESTALAIERNTTILRHFHASEPNLGDFCAPVAAHAEAAKALEHTGYRGWVALEMRAGDPPMPALGQAVDFMRKAYGQDV